MERDNVFNLNEQVNNWTEILKAKPSFTESDVEKVKSHFYDCYESLLAKGLNETEAFYLAKSRVGERFESDELYKQVNQPVKQIRYSLFILGGVIAYFLTYHLILTFAHLLIIILMISGIDGFVTVEWASRYLVTWYFIIMIFLASIYFFEKKTVAFLERIKPTPTHTVFLLIVTVLFGCADTCLLPVVKNVLKYNTDLRNQMMDYYINFDFSFPILVCFGFIFIYFRYYKKAKF